MSIRNLIVSFGASDHLARITGVRDFSWDEFAALLTAQPPESDDKASAGWFVPAEFSPRYRDSENLIARHALTLDYDAITAQDVIAIQHALKGYEYAVYTTASHTSEKPRIRVVMPTTRPMSADEFCAVSRKVASWAGIELAARESHVPAQMMFVPTVRAEAEFKGTVRKGQWLDVDAVLGLYDDWTDRAQWPTRKEHDSTYKADELPTPARDKPGIVGDFCRAFSITEAIERFALPYTRVSDTRWTYTDGTRAEGMRTYDEDSKAHNENDTNPARGQSNSFDLVRLHRFSALDERTSPDIDITGRPSFKAMVALALEQPEVRAAQAGADFQALPPLPEVPAPSTVAEGNGRSTDAADTRGPDSSSEHSPEDKRSVLQSAGLAHRLVDEIKNPTFPRWLIKEVLEKGVIAVMAGRRGSYKSFLALDWAMKCALRGDPVYVISAEGGDFDRRAKAWLIDNEHAGDVENIPLYVAQRRLDLSTKAGIDLVRADCKHHNIHPVLFVLDTFSKLSGGLDENDNSKVKAFIGLLDNGLKRAYDATVLLVAHTGHTEQGRPRGASALGADTDAEYIVSRNEIDNAVSVSRQRFKSSPELAPLHFTPEIIELDYADTEGTKVTSLVLLPAEAPANTKRAVLKKNPGKMLAIAREMLAEKDEFAIADLLNKFVEATPRDGTLRDRRRRTAVQALDVLLESKYLVLRNPDTVALMHATQGDVKDFM